MKQKLTWGMVSGLIAGAVAMLYWYNALVLVPTGIFGVQTLGNIKCYVVLVLLFGISFFLSFLIFSRIGKNVPEILVLKYILMIAGILLTGWLLYPQLKSVWAFPTWIAVLICILVSLCVCGSLTAGAKGNYSILFLILLIGIIWGIAAATVNIFCSAPWGKAFYDLHHSSAYIDSIFNVFRHKPFKGGLTDQYGHYALFFYLPIKIFGCNTVTIAVVLGILSAAVYILCMLSFCMVVRSNTVRMVTVVVGGIAGLNPMLDSIYWQCYPHRLVFPAITIFMITLCSQRGIKLGRCILGTVLTTLALLWNFESGIICSVAWFGFGVIYLFQKGKFTPKKLLFCGIALLADVIIPFVLALGIVNLYNFIVSTGSVRLLGIKEFVGMVVDDDYISLLRTDLPWGNELYIHKIFVFILCFCWGIFHNRIFGIKGNEAKADFGIAVSVMGLGLLTYYMNRTLAGNALVDLFFVLCLGLMLSGVMELAQKKWRVKNISMPALGKALCGIYACLFLVIYGLANLNVYEGFRTKYSYNLYNYEMFQDFVAQVGQAVPEGTWAKGEGTSAIYMELGWRNKSYQFGEVTAEDVMKHKKVFILDKYYEVVPQEFQMVQEFVYGELKYGYFVRE